MLKTPRFKSGASQVALVVKDLPANAGDVRDVASVPGLERDSGGGHGNPFWRIPMYRRAWQATVHGLQRVRHD